MAASLKTFFPKISERLAGSSTDTGVLLKVSLIASNLNVDIVLFLGFESANV